MTYRAVRVSAMLLPVLWLTACDEIDFDGNWDRYKEDFHYSYALQPGGRLSVENQNGSIEISSWDKDTVDITGTKHASSQQGLQNTKIDVTPSAGSISVRTIPSAGYRSIGARYVIRVPKRVQLDRIISSNGSIRVDNVEGMLNLKTSNGTVRTSQTRGDLEVTTSNGGIEMQHVGNARVHTTNGGIRGDVEKGYFDAGTSNGPINVRLTDPDATQPVRASSSNGHIELTLNTIREIRASSSNSSITVHLPANPNARLRAHTSNSSITTDFDVTVHGQQSKSNLEGNIGSGGPLIDLSSSNGSIKVLRN